MNGKDIVIDKD